jgi:hypothetical protein
MFNSLSTLPRLPHAIRFFRVLLPPGKLLHRADNAQQTPQPPSPIDKVGILRHLVMQFGSEYMSSSLFQAYCHRIQVVGTDQLGQYEKLWAGS